MKSKRRLREETEGEEYLHKAAWEVVKRQIAHAEANPKGSLYDDLVAMVFAFHCIEGYLNFVGEKVAPDLWANERLTFKHTGLTGKLATICQRCGIGTPDNGRRPFATVVELRKLRDRMAHPKIQKVRKTVEFMEGKLPPLFPKSYLATLISHTNAIRARDDVKLIADEIHAAAVAEFPHLALGRDALEGMHSMHSSTTRLVQPFDKAG